MSILLMKRYIDDGSYKELKRVEERVEVLREIVKQGHEEEISGRRMEWSQLGVVGKFVSKNVYETDMVGLSEFLFDLGILPYVCTINTKALSEQEVEILLTRCLPNDNYVRYTPNKNGRVDVSETHKECAWLKNAKVLDAVISWKDAKLRFDLLNRKWEKVRRIALYSALLRKKRKYTFSLGSFSLVEKKPDIRAADVIRVLGPDALIRCASVSMANLDEYMAMGFMKKSDISPFRRVVDIKSQYMLMEMKSETDAFAFFSRRTNHLAKLSMNTNYASS